MHCNISAYKCTQQFNDNISPQAIYTKYNKSIFFTMSKKYRNNNILLVYNEKMQCRTDRMVKYPLDVLYITLYLVIEFGNLRYAIFRANQQK